MGGRGIDDKRAIEVEMSISDRAMSEGRAARRAPAARPATAGWSGVPVRALILLAGAGRPTPFRAAIGRSVLDLPVRQDVRVLDEWAAAAAELSRRLGGGLLPVRLLLGSNAPAPDRPPASAPGLDFRQEVDPFEYRGTAGVLSDLAREYGDDDYLLVANAAQLLYRPLHELAEALAAEVAAGNAGVGMVAPRDGTPISLFLVKCAALRNVPEVGFIDLKEQALRTISVTHRVRVVREGSVAGRSIWQPDAYVESLRRLHSGDPLHAVDPLAEAQAPAFRIVEAGAEVDAKASLYDSVVLSGARLERRAVAVRSVICPGGRVRPGAVVVDRFVAPAMRGKVR